MKFRPLADRIIVRRSDAEKTTHGGIIIPDNVQEKAAQGTVLAVGPGRVFPSGQCVELAVKPGDLVLFGKYDGTEITIDGERVLSMVEENVFGVIEG